MVYNIYFDWYWSVKTLADTWHLNKSRCIRAYAHVHKCWSAVITVVALNDVARIFWSLFWGFLKHLSIAPPEAFHSTFQFLNWFRRIEKQKSFQRREKSGVNRKSAKMDNLSAASLAILMPFTMSILVVKSFENRLSAVKIARLTWRLIHS